MILCAHRACRALCNLVIDDERCQARLVRCDGIRSVVNVLRTHASSGDVCGVACALLKWVVQGLLSPHQSSGSGSRRIDIRAEVWSAGGVEAIAMAMRTHGDSVDKVSSAGSVLLRLLVVEEPGPPPPPSRKGSSSNRRSATG